MLVILIIGYYILDVSFLCYNIIMENKGNEGVILLTPGIVYGIYTMVQNPDPTIIGNIVGAIFLSLLYVVIMYPLSGSVSFITSLITSGPSFIEQNDKKQIIFRRTLDVYLGVSILLLYLLISGVEMPFDWLYMM
jgi:hypothetical protein